eukprot:sb/3477230/
MKQKLKFDHQLFCYLQEIEDAWNALQSPRLRRRATPQRGPVAYAKEDAILHKLLPAITGQPFIDANLRNIMALPARLGGLGVENPVIMATWRTWSMLTLLQLHPSFVKLL